MTTEEHIRQILLRVDPEILATAHERRPSSGELTGAANYLADLLAERKQGFADKGVALKSELWRIASLLDGATGLSPESDCRIKEARKKVLTLYKQ